MGRNSEGLPTSHDDGCGRRVPSPWRLAVLAGILAWLPIHADPADAAVHLAAPEVRATGEAAVADRRRDGLDAGLTLEGWLCGRDQTSEVASRVNKLNGTTRYLELATNAITTAARAQDKPESWSEGEVRRVVRPALRGSAYKSEDELLEYVWSADEVLRLAAIGPFQVLGMYYSAEWIEDVFKKRYVNPPIEQAVPDGPQVTYVLPDCYMRSQIEALAGVEVEAAKRVREAAERYKQAKAAVMAGRKP